MGVLVGAAVVGWKCGLGRVAASERLRVAHRLPELPRVRAAFAAGELSWSKVREITRVAEPHDEATWATIAANATASQVATLVRQARKVRPSLCGVPSGSLSRSPVRASPRAPRPEPWDQRDR